MNAGCENIQKMHFAGRSYDTAAPGICPLPRVFSRGRGDQGVRSSGDYQGFTHKILRRTEKKTLPPTIPKNHISSQFISVPRTFPWFVAMAIFILGGTG